MNESDRAEHIAALRFQIDAILSEIGRMFAELQEAVGSLRTLTGQLAQAASDGKDEGGRANGTDED